MIWIIMGIALILFLWLLYGYSMNFFLKTENYTINSPRIAKSFKAVLLADLHSASFGKKNEKLIRMIDKESPDLILMAGDMVVKNGKKLCVTKEFLTALSNKYPVYYSPGNHEIRMPDYEEYKNFLRDLGITYLENEQVYLPEYDLTITGLDLPEYYYHKCWQKRTFTKDTMVRRPVLIPKRAASCCWPTTRNIFLYTANGEQKSHAADIFMEVL